MDCPKMWRKKHHVPDILVSTCGSGNLGGKCVWLHFCESEPNSQRGKFAPVAGMIWWEGSWKLCKGKAALEETLQSSGEQVAATLTSFVLIQTLLSLLHLLSHNQCNVLTATQLSIISFYVLALFLIQIVAEITFVVACGSSLATKMWICKWGRVQGFKSQNKYCPQSIVLVGNYIAYRPLKLC